MSTAYMQDLPTGARFIGPDGHTVYEVTASADEHEHGWVFVWNHSMTDQYADELLATPGAVEQGCDPREGFFAYSNPTEVEVIEP